MTYNCYYTRLGMMHIAFFFSPLSFLKQKIFNKEKYLDISYTLSNDIKIMPLLFFYISKENVHQLGMKLGSRERKEIWAKLGPTYSLNYKVVSVSQSEWHRESNISVGFNGDRINYLSVKQIFKWEIRVLMDLFLMLLSSNSIDLLWLKGGWFHFCK